MVQFDHNIFSRSADRYEQGQQGLRNTFQNLANSYVKSQNVKDAKLEKAKLDAMKIYKDPNEIRAALARGEQPTPEQISYLEAEVGSKTTLTPDQGGNLVSNRPSLESQYPQLGAPVGAPVGAFNTLNPQIEQSVPVAPQTPMQAMPQRISPKARVAGEVALAKGAAEEAFNKKQEARQEERTIRSEKRVSDKKDKATINQAKSLVRTVKQLKHHKGLEGAVGVIQGQFSGAVPYTGDVAAFNALAEQVSGKTFLEAREQLKGAGQVTDFEGMKGERAMSRLNRVQSEEDYREAAQEVIEVTENGIARLEGKPVPHDFSEEEAEWKKQEAKKATGLSEEKKSRLEVLRAKRAKGEI